MPRILDVFLNKSTNNACKRYASPAAFFEGLKQEAPDAIRCLYAKVAGSIFNIGKKNRLTNEDTEELICDCISLCLQKINTGKYVFQGNNPASFVIEIAKYKVQNFRRKAMKNNTVDLEGMPIQAEAPDYVSQEQTALLETLLAMLNENCQHLVRLKYLEQYRDKEVIEQKKTQYSTVDALKNNRARCMKKLIELANQGM